MQSITSTSISYLLTIREFACIEKKKPTKLRNCRLQKVFQHYFAAISIGYTMEKCGVCPTSLWLSPRRSRGRLLQTSWLYRAHTPHVSIVYLTYTILNQVWLSGQSTSDPTTVASVRVPSERFCFSLLFFLFQNSHFASSQEKCGLCHHIIHTFGPIRFSKSDLVQYK